MTYLICITCVCRVGVINLAISLFSIVAQACCTSNQSYYLEKSNGIKYFEIPATQFSELHKMIKICIFFILILCVAFQDGNIVPVNMYSDKLE